MKLGSILVAFAICASLAGGPAQATLIKGDFLNSGDGYLVTDTATQLEWLAPIYTRSHLYNDALVQSLTTTHHFRYATATEIVNMINANFNNPVVGSPGNAAGFTSAQNFFNMFGLNENVNCSGTPCPRTQGLSGDPGSSANTHYAFGMIQFGSNGWMIAYNSWPDSIADTQMGSFLVRPVCGNGILNAGEQCDDGNPSGFDCCSSTCQIVAAGGTCRPAAGACDLPEVCDGSSTTCPADAKSTSTCRPAADVCDVAESCDGVGDACPPDALEPATTACRAGGDECDPGENCTGSSVSCPSDFKQSDGSPCSDGDACTLSDTCSAGACQSGSALDCDDDDSCTQDSCNAISGCINDPTPLTSCKIPGRTVLVLKDNGDDTKDRVVWKWLKGDTDPADLGVPTASTSYGICLFDRSAGVPNPIFGAQIAAGGAAWTAAGSSGFNFLDTAAAQQGAFKLLLRHGTPNRAKAIFIGKGAALNWTGTPLPFDQDGEVLVQLHNSEGQCWESHFVPAAKRNQNNVFRDVEP